MKDQAYFYKTCTEFTWIASFIHDWKSISNKEEVLSNLLSGLSKESSKIVTRILENINTIDSSESDIVDVFSPEEKEYINQYENGFFDKVFRNRNGSYQYNNYKLPINHFESSVFLHKHGIDRLENKENIKRGNIIDAGAFIGDSALILSEETERKVFSFEPCEENFKNLNRTIELNSVANVVPVNNGLSDSYEKVELYKSGSASSIIFNNNNSKTKETVTNITLDEFQKKNGIDIGLIKVDIEGYELKMLKGSLNTLRTQRPSLILSMYHSMSDFFHLKGYIESLNLGYKFKVHKPTDGLVMLETVLLAEVL